VKRKKGGGRNQASRRRVPTASFLIRKGERGYQWPVYQQEGRKGDRGRTVGPGEKEGEVYWGIVGKVLSRLFFIFFGGKISACPPVYPKRGKEKGGERARLAEGRGGRRKGRKEGDEGFVRDRRSGPLIFWEGKRGAGRFDVWQKE